MMTTPAAVNEENFVAVTNVQVSQYILDYSVKRPISVLFTPIGMEWFTHTFIWLSEGLIFIASAVLVMFVLYHSFCENCWCCTICSSMGLLPDTQNCGLCMRQECRERFPRHRLQRKPLVSDPDMHHDTCVTDVPWCMSESLNRGGGENVPGISRRMCNPQYHTSGKRPKINMWLLHAASIS